MANDISMIDSFRRMLVAEGYTGALPNQIQAWLNAGPMSVSMAESQCEITTPTTGFTYQVPDGVRDLQLTPAGLLLTGNIILPDTTNLPNGFQLTIGCTFAVTALGFTVGAGGASLSGAPAAIAAGGTIRFKYYKTSNTWYRR